MKQLIGIWSILLWAGVVSVVNAQYLSYDCISEESDLIEGNYSTLLQSFDGSLWVGASAGCWKYDGENTLPVPLNGVFNTLDISAVYEDAEGKKWMGYSTGQVAYEDELGQFLPWEIEEGWPQARITAMQKDSLGQLWIATYGEGVYCYRKGRLYQFGKEEGLVSEDIYDLVIDQAGLVWAANDAGICLLSWQEGEKEVRSFSTTDGLPDNIVTHLFADPDSGVWLGTYDAGIAYCQVKNNQLKVSLPDIWPGGVVSSIAKVDQGQLWVGTQEQGLHVFMLKEQKVIRQETQLEHPPQRIVKLLFDQEGLLWILSHDQGLCRVQARLLNWDNLPVATQAIAIDQQNQIWVGSQKGLYYRPASGGALVPYKLAEDLNIISLHVDHHNRLWLGTFGEGLFILDAEKLDLQEIGAAHGLGNGSILSISGDANGIWLATLGGVYYSPSPSAGGLPRFSRPEATQSIGTDFLYCNHIDHAGNVWFGTDGHGVSYVQKDGTLKTFRTSKDGTSINAVYAITEDGRGRIWISTNDQQLYYLEEGSFQKPKKPMAFGRNEVIGIGSDHFGNILITHQRGLMVYDVATEETIDYHHFYQEAGFSPALNAVATDKEGKVWLGGIRQLLCYTPFYGKYRQQPRLHLEQISVYLDPLDFENKTVLKANENNLIFSYQGVWLSDPEEVRFRYQLKGFDQDWIATRDHQAVYSNLPPGRYEFVVTASQNNQFSSSEQRVSYAFRIRPPLYLQGWFIGASILLVVLLGRYFLQKREGRLQKEALLLKDKVESQYETLKSQINPHFLFNSFNTLVALIEENPKGAVTYVEKLADFYRSILQYREQDAVNLSEEIQVVKDYHFLLTQRYQDHLQLDIAALPQGKRVPPLVVQMLIENAVKHNVISRHHPLKISIYTEANYLVVENAIQPKLTKQPSTGFGLQNIRNRYALLSTLPVKLEQDEKFFRISIPLVVDKLSQ
ncbi:ligand-binding sensor domain-containing protein [Lewinella cohaerens]|uniref:ligand-binding sensor domain-containing protein n=1 Tax=Lewinella cohaerens TaxID=70995 RepID=UPI0003740192|nr:sensor histidine kinase [Lewinella cohaerens]